MTYRKKMIEVAIRLSAINKEAAREKSIRHGQPEHDAHLGAGGHARAIRVMTEVMS